MKLNPRAVRNVKEVSSFFKINNVLVFNLVFMSKSGGSAG